MLLHFILANSGLINVIRRFALDMCHDAPCNLSVMWLTLTSVVLFVLGLIGMIIHRQRILKLLLSSLLIVLASAINFIAFAKIQGNHTGAVIALFIILMFSFEVITALTISLLIYYKRAER